MTIPVPRSRVALEVAVTSAAGVRAAAAGGADRVELCTALELGGLTPSPGVVEEAVAAGAGTGLGVHVLVRVRPGDFVHDADEAATLRRDVAHAVRAGAAGVVVGGLTAGGDLDTALLAAAVQAARGERAGVEVTLHRAVDQLARPSEHLAGLAALGVTRVLSSGGAPSAPAGVDELARMVAAAPGLQVMAGGGVSAASVGDLLVAAVAAVHLSARRGVPGRGPSRVAVGSSRAGTAVEPAGDHAVTDAALVAAVRAALDRVAGAAGSAASPGAAP